MKKNVLVVLAGVVALAFVFAGCGRNDLETYKNRTETAEVNLKTCSENSAKLKAENEKLKAELKACQDGNAKIEKSSAIYQDELLKCQNKSMVKPKPRAKKPVVKKLAPAPTGQPSRFVPATPAPALTGQSRFRPAPAAGCEGRPELGPCPETKNVLTNQNRFRQATPCPECENR